MIEIIAFCRPGYEAEALAEWLSFGLKERSRHSGCVRVYDDYSPPIPPVAELIFSRSYFHVKATISELSDVDRATPIAAAIAEALHRSEDSDLLYNELRIVHSDSEEGKPLSRFCSSFAKPLENKLKAAKVKKVFSRKGLPIVHVLFLDYETAVVGIAQIEECSPWTTGIPRLRKLANAPSRSALKLEEAWISFLDEEDQAEWLCEGRSAVDLGAAPGGWTLALMNRGVFVTAVDNGSLAEDVANNDRCKHKMQDAFKYKPKQSSDWLVCDVVENPYRICDLIIQWHHSDWFKRAIVNLKLPMGQRFDASQKLRAKLKENLGKRDQVLLKHLYHDRDEITLYVARYRKE